ncbi:MAG: hypothetical protein NTX79_06545 [Candidatus Micrarchaeota archaeon]|nr:hypothetical protein [Candidatus Micrarchaeota archaeon]
MLRPKIYIETSSLLAGSIAIKVKGKTYRHRQYDNAAAVFVYAEQCFEKGTKLFYVTPSVEMQSRSKLGKALNNMIVEQIPTLRRKALKDKKYAAENFYNLYLFCYDALEMWLSFFEKESIDGRSKQEYMQKIQDEYRNLDIKFKGEYSNSWRDFGFFDLSGRIRSAARFARTVQHREAIKKYKPNPDRNDIEILAEAISINAGKDAEVYFISEDGHFVSEL